MREVLLYTLSAIAYGHRDSIITRFFMATFHDNANTSLGTSNRRVYNASLWRCLIRSRLNYLDHSLWLQVTFLRLLRLSGRPLRLEVLVAEKAQLLKKKLTGRRTTPSALNVVL